MEYKQSRSAHKYQMHMRDIMNRLDEVDMSGVEDEFDKDDTEYDDWFNHIQDSKRDFTQAHSFRILIIEFTVSIALRFQARHFMKRLEKFVQNSESADIDWSETKSTFSSIFRIKFTGYPPVLDVFLNAVKEPLDKKHVSYRIVSDETKSPTHSEIGHA